MRPKPDLRDLPSRVRAKFAQASKSPYWLFRFVFLRALGFVYFVAFFSLANQLLPLLGENGLLPADLWLEQRAGGAEGAWAAFLELPSLFWLDASDGVLVATCWLGAALSLVVVCGYANALLMAVLWFLYMSFVHVGQTWFSFGWEMQLLETGVLAVFLCPLLDGRPFPRSPPPRVVVWLVRWLCFRLMLGAGLIKLRGDPCWDDLTCLLYHFETQPIPHPGAWYFHNLPAWVHTLGVLFNHLVEVVVPFFVFGPRIARHLAGGFLVLFQVVLIAGGNYSFLNWLTIVAALGCFDDTLWRRLLPARVVAACERAVANASPSRAHTAAAVAYALLVAMLSVAPTLNLLSPSQIMNTSFDRLHLVNTYGLFGSIGRQRGEVVLAGTTDEEIDDETVWVEYEWKCKPGDPQRRPCLITPYHLRLDWLIWFAAMSSYERHPWTVHLVWKLLHNDPGALSLLAGNPFPDAPPRYVRADLYLYEFTDWSDESGAWWKRKKVRVYLAPMAAENQKLQAFLRSYRWID